MTDVQVSLEAAKALVTASNLREYEAARASLSAAIRVVELREGDAPAVPAGCCDWWGDCDEKAVAWRRWDGGWLSVCESHALSAPSWAVELREGDEQLEAKVTDAIWRTEYADPKATHRDLARAAIAAVEEHREGKK